MADADRSVRPPCGLECHSPCRLIALYSDRVEYIDRCAIARMADSVTAIIGADQPDAGLEVGSEGNIVWREAPRLIAEADAFTLCTPGAGEQNTSSRGFVASVRRERPLKRKANPPAVGIWLTQIPPFATLGILFKESVENYFARRVLAIMLHPFDADAPLPPGAIPKHQNCARQLLLRDNPPVS